MMQPLCHKEKVGSETRNLASMPTLCCHPTVNMTVKGFLLRGTIYLLLKLYLRFAFKSTPNETHRRPLFIYQNIFA